LARKKNPEIKLGEELRLSDLPFWPIKSDQDAVECVAFGVALERRADAELEALRRLKAPFLCVREE
jgi:hypothetical protein